MSMAEDRRRYRAAGLEAQYFRWPREAFMEGMEAILEALKADESLEPRARFGLTEKGVVTLWHYTSRPEKAPKASGYGEESEGFNIAVPCPPDCDPPPNGD
jgi:hypothetical protein